MRKQTHTHTKSIYGCILGSPPPSSRPSPSQTFVRLFAFVAVVAHRRQRLAAGALLVALPILLLDTVLISFATLSLQARVELLLVPGLVFCFVLRRSRNASAEWCCVSYLRHVRLPKALRQTNSIAQSSAHFDIMIQQSGYITNQVLDCVLACSGLVRDPGLFQVQVLARLANVQRDCLVHAAQEGGQRR